MRIELWIFLITGIFIYDTYYEHKYSKMIMSYKKYYKIILIAIASIFVYFLFKKKPEQFRDLVKNGTNLFRYLPVGKETMEIITPMMEMNDYKEEILTKINETPSQTPQKRNVSETKKRYVASMQNWKCGKCQQQLTHTYEIDHIHALRDGGDNSVENLLALCRSCHGEKTAESFLK